MNISVIQKSLDLLSKGRITVSNRQPNSISLHGKPTNYHEVQRAICAVRNVFGPKVKINLDDVLQKLRLREEISQDTQSPTTSDTSLFIG